MTIDDEYLEHHLGSLMTTAGTDLGEQTAVAPEIVTRARRRIDVDELFTGVRAGERTHISRAITLLESTAPAHRVLAQELLVKLLPFTGNALRVGITGVPGVGKSTFIEALGMTLIGDGHKLAVLAIDPSSTKTRGSILGDKTRMAKLAREDNAFIRPSPSAGTLGGVAKATRESMVVFEAAGFDVILVETVGVGQSEVAVSQMVDCFTLLALAGAGDQLHPRDGGPGGNQQGRRPKPEERKTSRPGTIGSHAHGPARKRLMAPTHNDHVRRRTRRHRHVLEARARPPQGHARIRRLRTHAQRTTSAMDVVHGA